MRPLAPRAAFGALTSRIGRRFIALFAGCALLPLVVFAWIAIGHTGEQLRNEQIGALHNGAKTAGMGIAARLSQVVGDLALAREFALRAGGRDLDGLATLRRHVEARCAAVWIADGTELLPLCGGEPVQLPSPQASTTAHLGAGKAVLQTVGSPPCLVLSAAVHPDAPASPRIVVRIRSEWFWDPGELRAADCDVAVFDGLWRPLFSTFDRLPDVRSLVAQSLQNSASGTFEWAPEGEAHLARYWRAFLKPQYDFDLLIVQSRATAAVTAVSARFTWWLLLTTLCTLLLVVVVSLVQMRRTLDPIVSLREATRRITSGDLSSRVVIRSADEFGELGAAFNDMAARLQENVRRREQTERDLVASRDAALAAARAKAEFVTNVSHEFRTPMAEILGATEILAQLGDDDAAAHDEFSRIAWRGAQRLARLVDDVLELGTDEVWTMASVDVAATVRAAVGNLPEPQRGRVHVDVGREPAHVVGNAQRLTETWGRLLDNALKFSAANAPVEIAVRSAGRDIVVEVRDHGVGIAAADRQRIFEPFSQVGRDQLTDKASGTGLGLTLARNAVDRHGGRIEVDSVPGAGSTFRIVLPAQVERPAVRV